MSTSSRSGYPTAVNVDRMMARLGIDLGCCVAPRFGWALSCALRTCSACTAREPCTQWLAKEREAAFGPPRFCPNDELLWELLCDPAIGRHRHPVL